jgi:hypothetical protein
MRFRKEISFDGTTEAVYAMLSDPAFREEVCRAAGATSYDVTVTPTDTGLESVIETSSPVDGLPALVKKLLGSTMTLHQVERWASPDAATMQVSVPGTPGAFTGTIRLQSTDTGATQTVEADIRVGVPIIGAKIEALIGSGLGHVLKVQARVGADWLSR